MTPWSELAWLDATELAARIAHRELSAPEVTDAAVAAIEQHNPALNAVIAPLYERARGKAAGLLSGPFAGVPFLLKDLLAELAGTPLNEGTAFLDGYVSPHDSELAARFERAGLIVLGKTNTPELALLPTTEPRRFGATHNPWNPALTTGGSSGGSAAAVAAGLVPMAHANDGGGSIRIPASCCGLFGLKPTRGRNPLGPDYGDLAGGLICEHAVTRSVRDSAALLDATAGPLRGDPYVISPPAQPYSEEARTAPGRLRIAFSTAPVTGLPVHADCVAAVKEAARLCEELGHEVSEAAPRLDAELLVRRFGHVWTAMLGWAIRDWARRTGREPREANFEPATWRGYEVHNRRTPADYLLALQDLQRLAREIAAFCAGYDLWLTPTLRQPPMPLGYFDHDPAEPQRSPERQGEYSHFTLLANVTGQPAMSVPLHWNAEGLPIGVHFMAGFGREAVLFRLAGQLEQARPWAGHRPPLGVGQGGQGGSAATGA
ncbi:MAG TPA: amidase [bacterium]|nr:amidase [bacterium]